MKLRLCHLLVIILIISCQDPQTKEITPKVNYIENFEIGSKKIDSNDFLGIPNQYEVKFSYNGQDSSKSVFDLKYDVLFNMYFIDGKNHFIPSQINIDYAGFFSPIQFHRRSQTVVVRKNVTNEIEFEIEFCFQIVKEKNNLKEGRLTNLARQVKKAIEKLNHSETLRKIRISSSNNPTNIKEKNEVCRTFQFSKKENSIIVRNTNHRKELVPRELIESGIIEIIESGDIMDTLIVSQKVWDQKGFAGN